MIRRLLAALIALRVLFRARREGGEEAGHDGPPEDRTDPTHRDASPNPRAELAAAGALAFAGLCGLAFVGLYLVFPDTQLLGLTLGLGLCAGAAAAILGGNRIVPRETKVEERPELVDERAEREVDDTARAGVQGVSRRRLLVGAAGAAGAGLTAAVAAPLASLGPNVDERIDTTPWRRGRLIVDERGRPILADDVGDGTFLTGFPAGADRRELGSPVVMVRVPPAKLDLPRSRRGWAPEGIVAYSKICTHAGCAIALYRKPTYAPTQPRAGLVCPCHYSTFDPARAAAVIFGPAGRPLPQLPLAIDAQRRLVAAGGFSGSVGPSWFNVRRG